MWFFVRTPLYGTIWALLIGYIATYLPYGIRPLTSAFVQIHRDLEESSRIFGGGMLYTLRRIVVPLMVPGIASAWILMATMFVRELSVSVVLSQTRERGVGCSDPEVCGGWPMGKTLRLGNSDDSRIHNPCVSSLFRRKKIDEAIQGRTVDSYILNS